MEEEESERVLLCLGGGPIFLTLRDLDTDLCLLSLFFGEAGCVLLLEVGLGDGVLLLGGDISVLGLFLGGVLSGDLSLVLCTESLLELE